MIPHVLQLLAYCTFATSLVQFNRLDPSRKDLSFETLFVITAIFSLTLFDVLSYVHPAVLSHLNILEVTLSYPSFNLKMRLSLCIYACCVGVSPDTSDWYIVPSLP